MGGARKLHGRPKQRTARQERQLRAKDLEKRIALHPCGDCTACCTVNVVAQLAKPAGTHCAHVGDAGGCRIYQGRPDACRDYFCAWQFGIVGDDVAFRPDRLGLVIDVSERPPPGVLMLRVRELTPGAIDTHTKELNELIARSGAVLYLVRGDRRFFMGPEEKVHACQTFSKRSLPLVSQ